MSDVTVDASELTAFGRRVAAAHAMASVKVAQAVKKGAQNVKEGVISDLQTSSNYAISRIGIGYEMGSTGTTIYADVSPATAELPTWPTSRSSAPRKAAEPTGFTSSPNRNCPRSPNTWETRPTTC